MSSAPSPPTSLTQLALDDGDRPRYSETQLHNYFDRIGLSQQYLDSPVLSNKAHAATKEHGLPFLQALTRYRS